MKQNIFVKLEKKVQVKKMC